MPKVEDFVANFFNNQTTDLTVYNDQIFCSELRLHALLAIHPMINLAHKYQHSRWMNANVDKSNKILNKPHISTGLTILDYCIVAGLNDIAIKAIALGCETSLSVQRLQQLCSSATVNNKSPIMVDMRTTVEQIIDHRCTMLQNKTNAKKSQSQIQKIGKYLQSDYKYMLGAFVFAVIFAISFFFFSGLAAKALLCSSLGSLFTGAVLHRDIEYKEKREAIFKASQETMAETIKIAQLLDLSTKELKLSRVIAKTQDHDKKSEYVHDNHTFYLPSAGEVLHGNKKLAFDIASILGFKKKAKF